jgi:hypothetical protein
MVTAKALDRKELKSKVSFYDELEEKVFDKMLENGFENLADYLINLAERTTLMHDVEDVMREDYEYFDILGINDFIVAFQDGWRQTDYYNIKIYTPILNLTTKSAKELDIEDDYSDIYISETITEIIFELVDIFFWDPFHSCHDSYDIARKILKESVTE